MIRSMEAANKVLAAVEQTGVDSSEWYLEPYQNGREHGYAIFVPLGRKVVFSEYRNTDAIVVYTGGWSDFYPAGNVPNEKAYGGKRFFQYDDHEGAAKFIVEYLTQEQA